MARFANFRVSGRVFGAVSSVTRLLSARTCARVACGLLWAVAAHAQEPPPSASEDRSQAADEPAVAAASLPGQDEPSLAEAEAAAARRAGGSEGEDTSRVARARRSHWLPTLRTQIGGKHGSRARRGQARTAPIAEDDATADLAWGLAAQWDLSQILYTRDESQLALAHAQLARARAAAAEHAAGLWIERRRNLRALRGATTPGARFEAALQLLLVTGELDAATGGLFHEQVRGAQALCDAAQAAEGAKR